MLGDEATFTISSSHLLYSLREEGEGEGKKEARLPQAVTTPRKGPLVLRVSRRTGKEASHQETCSQQPPRHTHGMFLLTKKPKSSLTRFPVVMVQRPLQQIEEQLGELSCAALRENIQFMPDSNQKQVSLPHLHPMMKYSVLGNHLHGNHVAPPTHRTERYTHRDAGPMDISITYSRQHKERAPHPTSPPPPLPSTPPPPTSPQVNTRPSFPLGQSTLTHPLSSSHLTTHKPPVHLTSAEPSPSLLPLPRLTHRHTSPQAPHGQQPPPLPLPPSHSSFFLPPPPPRSGLAPHSIQAVIVHKRKPLTRHTTLRGHRIHRTV